MAISLVTSAAATGNPTTSFTVTLPAVATQAGDIIILEYTHRGTGDATLGGTYNGGAFTEKHDQQYATSTFSGKTLWSRATGDHQGQTITGSGLTNSCAAVVTVYRGALESGDPLADATVVGEQNAAGNETQAQITTATNGSWVVLVVANSPDVDVSAQACTSPTLVERIEKLSTGGTDTSISHASGEKATAGATGAFTWSQTDGASGSWAYAIKPAAIIAADGAAAGSGTPTGAGAAVAASVVTADGVAASTVAGAMLAASVASATGVATAAADGEDGAAGTIVEADGSSSGASTVSGVGAAVSAGVSAAAGLAAAAALAVAIFAGVLSSDGLAAVTGQAAAVSSADGSSAGVGAGASAGSALAASVGGSAGAAVVDGQGGNGADTGSDGTATGSASVAAVGAAITAAPATSSGTAAGDARGAGILASQAVAAGVSSVVAESAAQHQVVASAQGIATAQAQSEAGGIPALDPGITAATRSLQPDNTTRELEVIPS